MVLLIPEALVGKYTVWCIIDWHYIAQFATLVDIGLSHRLHLALFLGGIIP